MKKSINLLPELRVIKIKNARRKRFLTTLTILTGIVAAAVIVGLIIVIGYYTTEFNLRENKAKELKAEVDKSRAMEEDAATIQEHLASFVQINSNRISASNIFSQLVKTIPPNVSITSFQVTETYVATIVGTADTYKTLGTFTKALEDYNVTFKQQEGQARKAVFTNVEITQSAKDKNGSVTYGMTFKVDESIAKVNMNQSNEPIQ